VDQVSAGELVSVTVLTQPAVTMTIPARAAKNSFFIRLQSNRKRRGRQAPFTSLILKLSAATGFY
jgi:hypothetical protein